MSELNSFKVDVSINGSKEKVWQALYERFGETALFNPNIISSEYIKGDSGQLGCERECMLDSKTYVKEKIIDVEGTNSFSIDIYETNMPMMKTMIARFDLLEISKENTSVSMTFNYNASPSFMAAIMKMPMKSKLVRLLIGLKYFIETGKTMQDSNFRSVFKTYKRLDEQQAFAV